MTQHIHVNGEPLKIQVPISLVDLLEQHHGKPTAPFSVAVNGDFVPRTQYADVTIQPGDELDIVSPVGGG